MTLSAFDRLAQVRRHAALGQLVLGAPMPVAFAGVLWRFASPAVAVSVALAGIAVLAALAWRRTRAFDTAWLVRQLDARRKDLDDSSDLLLAPPASLTPLQQLQQARVRERLRSQPAPDLRTPWPWPRIVAMWLVANEPGILARVVGLFSGRGYNIESLTVAETNARESQSRITIVTKGTPMIIEQIKAQLDRLVPVYRVRDLTVEGPHIERELALVKVKGVGEKRVEALRLADVFRAKVIDAKSDSFVFEVTGNTDKVQTFVGLMESLGLVDVVRTGIVAMSRGGDAL